MVKAQGKKATAGTKAAAKKVVARVKSRPVTARKKVAAKKKPAASARPAARKAAKAAPKPAPKASAKTVKKGASPAKSPARSPLKTALKAVAKVVKTATKKVTARVVAKASPALTKAASSAVKTKAVKGRPAAPNVPALPKPATAAKTAATKPGSPKSAVAPLPVTKTAVVKPAPEKPAGAKPAPAPEEKKRGRRARPRIHSSGAPAASWLSTEKPRPASFIAAPARAEAPSAIAAPPASSDRLHRPDDVGHPAVRTVPVRIDIEQAAGRFYVIANPLEVTVRVGEGIEWDFRYIGGADVTIEEVVVELEKPSPFTQTIFRTRKPGGARPHRQLSGGALPAAAGKRTQYTVRAINQFKTELARTQLFLSVTA